jgi:hypothetical protein
MSYFEYYSLGFCVKSRVWPLLKNIFLKSPELEFTLFLCSTIEATFLEYTRLGVSQDILFRYNYSQWEIGGRFYTKRRENKCCPYLRNINTGSNWFFDVLYTIYPRFLIGKLEYRMFSVTRSLAYSKDVASVVFIWHKKFLFTIQQKFSLLVLSYSQEIMTTLR